MVLILTLLVVVLLVGALALAVAFAQEKQKAVYRETGQIRLVALTDAALAETLARLARSPAAGGMPEQDFGGGTMESWVQHAGPNQRVIRSRATFRGRQRTTEAHVRLTASGPRVLDWRVVTASEAAAGVKR